MSDWFFKQNTRGRLWRRLGIIDSWLDSTLAGLWQGLLDRWNAGSSFFARFRLTGWRRLLNEAMSEGLTLTAGGLALMYALAVPAFQEMDESKILGTGKYSVKFIDQNGKELGQRGILHNDAVPLDEIPDHLIKATLATEDRRFFEHFGIDVLGTLRALVTNLSAGETVQGGSTLTQQLAKNLFLSSERSLTRKIKELFLSFWLEARFTKRQILKLYFDRAYMGGGAFGVEAAAQLYFGKSVRDVTLAEAAMMAGLFKAPTKYGPLIDLPAARARANEVLSNLVEAGFMTAGQVHNARLNPARPIENRLAYSPDWYLDWAFEEVQRIAEGRGYYVLTARVTVDLRLQQAAEQALISAIRQEGRSHHAKSGALVSMEPDGAVRALVGGLDYGESQFNRATHARRQPGSSFKLYVYANAVEHGLTPSSTVYDRSVSCGNWSPKNYDGSSGGRGAMSMGTAFAKSINTTAVELSLKYDRENVIKLTRRLGIEGVKKTCSMALGDGGVTVLEHTGAYAAFANDGKLARPYAVLELMNSRGEVIYSRERDEPPAPQVMKPKHAEYMNQMMQMVVTEGTGKRAALDFTNAVGKTGTSSSYRDAWFMGFTGDYVTGVWIGNDDFRPMDRVTGGSIPATTWHNFMQVAHASMNIKQIPGLPLHPTQVAERARIEELKRTQPQLAQELAARGTGRDRLMSDKLKAALRKVARTMRTAGGLPEPAADQRSNASTGSRFGASSAIGDPAPQNARLTAPALSTGAATTGGATR
ncbi:MAG: PBP1A family penicillin-binding protein [Hyphomicrobiaceae bacterium]